MKSFKKIAALIVMGCAVLGTASALDFSLSAGGGGYFNGIFGSLKVGDSETKTTNVGGGAYLFFDATYAEANVDILLGSSSTDVEGSEATSTTHFGFSVLGKYPIALGNLTVFPLAGIDYQIFLSGKSGDIDIERGDLEGDLTDMYDAFSIQVGAGLDFGFTEALYLRGEVLVGFKLNSTYEQKLVDNADATVVNIGPRVKLAVGYKF